jgi:DNA modification methylase
MELLCRYQDINESHVQHGYSYKNDIVLDPFCGSATTMVAAEVLDRRWIGIELSPNYTKIGTDRVQAFVDNKKQMKIEFEEGAE